MTSKLFKKPRNTISTLKLVHSHIIEEYINIDSTKMPNNININLVAIVVLFSCLRKR